MNSLCNEVYDPDYRPNVGIMLINKQHQILAGEAIHCSGEWMMPQGGIDQGETPHQALQRELVEETGIEFRAVNLIQENSEWISYLFRKPLIKNGQLYIGQRQKWFLLEYNGSIPNAETTIDREFSQFNWVEIDWLIEHTTQFKKEVYRSVFETFHTSFP
ncbi:MAG: RNA pyrophosphohydrolase [Gammaproteobacteria bacterium]|nr:RNA pyrophosphohydrolase [Gammaproteobacteria bacterium]